MYGAGPPKTTSTNRLRTRARYRSPSLQAWPVLRSSFQSCANQRGRSDGFTLFICGSGLANSGADGADGGMFSRRADDLAQGAARAHAAIIASPITGTYLRVGLAILLCRFINLTR